MPDDCSGGGAAAWLVPRAAGSRARGFVRLLAPYAGIVARAPSEEKRPPAEMAKDGRPPASCWMSQPRPVEKPYTMKEALKDAAELLKAQFGTAEQQPTVALATFLFGAHERETFLKARAQPDERAFM